MEGTSHEQVRHCDKARDKCEEQVPWDVRDFVKRLVQGWIAPRGR